MMSVDNVIMKKINKQLTDAEFLCVVASTTGLDSRHKHGAARCGTENFPKHQRKTHKYKQQTKHNLFLTFPAHVR